MHQHYTLTMLKPNFCLIRWFATSTPETDEHFLKALQTLLNAAPAPIYFLSDVRRGRIVDVRSISRLSALTRHANWAGSTAFSETSLSSIFVSTFQRLSNTPKERDAMHHRLEDALAFLESHSPGITADVDWAAVLELNR